jgi:general secretion pathway protein J
MQKQGLTHRGFTLLEIVVAVGIFAVIASIVFPAMIQFLDTRERVTKKHSEIVGLQKTFQFLARDLRFAASRLSKDEYGEPGKTTLLLNDDDLLDFTAVYPDLSMTGLSVPRRVVWRIDENRLQRIQYPVMDPDSETRRITQFLLDGVKNIEIEVSFIEDGRSSTERRWEEQSKLPDMIEITVELSNDLQYTRILDMQGGDSAKALLAAGVAPTQAGNPGEESATTFPEDEAQNVIDQGSSSGVSDR